MHFQKCAWLPRTLWTRLYSAKSNLKTPPYGTLHFGSNTLRRLVLGEFQIFHLTQRRPMSKAKHEMHFILQLPQRRPIAQHSHCVAILMYYDCIRLQTIQRSLCWKLFYIILWHDTFGTTARDSAGNLLSKQQNRRIRAKLEYRGRLRVPDRTENIWMKRKR